MSDKLTNKELLRRLRAFYREYGRSPKACEFPHRTLSAAVWVVERGTPERAELPLNHERGLTAGDLLERLRAFYQEHGRSPTIREVSFIFLYYERFGSWNNALLAAGLPLNRKRPPDRIVVTKAQLYHWYEKRQMTQNEIAQRPGCSAVYVGTLMAQHGIATRRLSEYLNYPRQSFSGDPIEKAYFIGFRLGDLYVYKKRDTETCETIVVNCASTRSAQIDLITSLFDQYGHIGIKATERMTYVTCHLDLSFAFLLPKEDRTESWILSDDDCFLAFFAGYVDAEGHIGISNTANKAYLKVASYDKNILCQAQAKLEQLGIACPRPRISECKGNRGKRQDLWNLGVYRKRSLDRLFALLDPHLKHAKRRADMAAAWANVKVRGL